MENASKALLMSAGVLIGVLIASLFAYELLSMSKLGQTYKEQMDLKTAEEFNTGIAKYSGIELRAQDIITICNYIIEWNEENPYSSIRYETKDKTIKKVFTKQISTEEFLNNNSRENIPYYR